MKIIQILATLVFITSLAGCAGTDFKRPDPQLLQVGKSSSADVSRVMGKPMQTGELIKNNEKVQMVRYAYAEAAGASLYPGVVPARSMVFMTFNGQLVAQEFSSSFASDATDFDEAKISSILKGKSTRADVISLLGRPTGDALYPLIKSKLESGIVYSYGQTKGTVFNMKFYNKELIISLDANNVVTDIDYTAVGQK